MLNVWASRKYKSPESVAISRYEMPELVEADFLKVVVALMVERRLSLVFAFAFIKA